MDDCLFCNIASGRIKSDLVYEDDQVVAFRDINPQAPVHILIIPRKHIPTLNEAVEADEGLMGHILLVSGRIAAKIGVEKSGYRIIMNCNKDAGQVVFHVHFHLLAGRNLGPLTA